MIDIRDLLNHAVSKDASDVHICVGASPRLRIHGELLDTNFQRMTPADTLGILLNLINQEQRERFEQDGEIDISVSVPDAGRFRINAYKQRGFITLSFRIVDQQMPDPSELNLPEAVLSLCERRRGLVFVTGPSGSGKSTVIAAMLDRINSTRACNIITLEDPIEYLHSHKSSIINQREIGLDVKSYDAGLRSALREDPDVIFVSRLDTVESILTAMMAVETGKLVFTSMYTSSALDTIRALADVFPEGRQGAVLSRLSATLIAVISRQLLTRPDNGGRIPAHEILITDHEVRHALAEGRLSDLQEIMKRKHDRGMVMMDESLLQLVKDGLIDPESALAVSCDQEAFEKAISL